MLNIRISIQAALSILAASATMLSGGCVTTPTTGKDSLRSSSQKTPMAPMVAPPAPAQETSRQAAGQAPLILAAVPDSQIADFASRHALSVARLSETDEQLLNRMPNHPQPGSIHEAAMVLGIVKTFSPINIETNTFNEQELSDGKNEQLKKSDAQENAVSGLEKAALMRGIDLPGAVEVNPFLQSASVVRLITFAAEKGRNSEAFNARLRSATLKQVSEWRNLSERYNHELAEVPEIKAAPMDSPPPTGDAARAIIEGTSGVSDLHSSDLVINDAGRQADEGQFDQAIETLKRVEKISPLYKLSQEKAKEFANSAVRDMRRKAAQAFSAANQANDAGTKGSYLDKAKSILEEAVKKYPDADQLGTVRENLTVIIRDLDRLRGSSNRP